MDDFFDYMAQSEPSDEAAPVRDFLDGVLQRIRLRARRRITWLRHLWTEPAAREDRAELKKYQSEVDGYLNNADNPASEIAWLAATESMGFWNQELAELEYRLDGDNTSRLAYLSRVFGLNRIEKDILQACLALAIEPNLGRVYAYLQDHSGRNYVTEALVARLFGHGRYLAIGPESPMRIWGLVVESEVGRGESLRFDCDPFIRNWLLGASDMDEALVGIVRRQSLVQEPLSNWPIERAQEFISRVMTGETQAIARLFVAGAEGSGRRSFASVLSARFGLPLLTIDTSRIGDQHWPQIFMRAQRLAHLNPCALAWDGLGRQERQWPQHIPLFQLQFVIGEVDEFILPETTTIDYRVELPPIPMTERRALWLQLVPAAREWPEKKMAELVQLHQVTIGQIVAVAAHEVTTAGEVSETLRESSRRRLGNLAQQMTGNFDWNDLIVPQWLRTGLQDFAFEAKERTALWEENPSVQRLFPQGKGLIGLFTGSPGTGKTMAAQVIANSLQLDLFRIDLSTVVSKYIGETSKNIERILSRAQRMDVVLLFDEADALFGRRTEVKDAHDRFANIDTNYLLQAIEQYPGVAILTSNRKASIDLGFMRRLRYVLDFPKPDAGQRLLLWQTLMRELAGARRANVLKQDVTQLADLLDLTGAQIKLAILSAQFMARQQKTALKASHLLYGLERELMKEGRGLGRKVYELVKA